MNIDELWEKGIQGKLVFNEDENQYQLQGKYMAFGVNAMLDQLADEEIIISMKLVKKDEHKTD